MRILYTTSVTYAGRDAAGYNVHIDNVVSRLRRRGHDVSLYACSERGAPAAREAHLVDLGPLPKGPYSLARFNLTYLRKLAADRNPRPDAVYSRLGVWDFTPALFARQQRIPRVLEVNGVPDLDRRLSRPHRHLLRTVFRSAVRVVVTNDSMADHFASSFDVPGERFVTITNGVDVSLYHPTVRARVRHTPVGRPLIGYVGLLAEHWGLDLLWRAAPEIVARSPDALFVLAGAGPIEAEIRKRFAELGLASHLLVLGPVSYAAAAEIMAECDVLVGPLRPVPRNEMSSPIKIYHYLAVGKPTVATAMRVMNQFDGSGLITFRADDPQAFAEAVVRGLELPERSRRELGKRSFEFIRDHHTWDHTVDRIEQLLSEVARA